MDSVSDGTSGFILSTKVISRGGFWIDHQCITTVQETVVVIGPIYIICARSPQGCRGAGEDDGILRMSQCRHGNNRQIQHLNANASRCIRERMRIFARLREQIAIPEVTVAGCFAKICGVGTQCNGHRRRIIRRIAFGLLSAVLRNTCTRTVHGNHQTVYIRETTQGGNRYAHIGLYAAVHWQTLAYHKRTDGITTVCIGKDSDRIGCIKHVVALVAIRERKRKRIIALHLRERRCLHSHIRHCIKWATVLVDGGSLLQEVVVWSPHHTFGIGERQCIVKLILWNRQILIHIGNIVHVLVPYLAGGSPRFACGLKNIHMTIVSHRISSTCDNFGLTISIHIHNNRILNLCIAPTRINSHIIRLRNHFSCLMMVKTSVDNSQIRNVTIYQLRITILVEVK